MTSERYNLQIVGAEIRDKCFDTSFNFILQSAHHRTVKHTIMEGERWIVGDNLGVELLVSN